MRQIHDNVIPVQTAASINSDAIPALNLLYCSVQAVTTGSSDGTCFLEASNDPFVTPGNTPPVNWSAIPSAAVVVSGAGAVLIPKTDLCYEWVRVVYTNTGTGTVSVTFKAIGA